MHGADTAAVDLLLLSYASSTPVAESRVLSSVQVAGRTQEHPDACNVSLARLRRGDMTDAASIFATEPAMDDKLPASEVVMTVRRGLVAQAAICGQVLRGVLASFSPSEDRWLLRADSVMRHLQLNYGALWNYDVNGRRSPATRRTPSRRIVTTCSGARIQTRHSGHSETACAKS